MKNTVFKKTLLISVLGHIAAFSIFSISFGDKILKAGDTSVSFFGSILNRYDLSNRSYISPGLTRAGSFVKETNLAVLTKKNKDYSLVAPQYFKPLVSSPFNNKEKETFVPKNKTMLTLPKRKDPTLIFHPLLPYDFLLYFKDRQRVHIELMFNIVPTARASAILIKRKISSGNLEADLLSIRYISHYLFIQQAKFSPNNWQVVKIDLSPQND